MRVFAGFNQTNEDVCPVCQTNKDEPTVLVPIPGTEDDGIMEAKQVHEECYGNIKAIIGNVLYEANNE